MTGCPSLGHGTVVMLLMMIAVRDVLSSHGSVQAWVVLMNLGGVGMASREHELIGGTPESGGHGKTVELMTGGSHGGGLGLSRVGGILEVHALKTMSQSRHVGSRVASLRTVAGVVVAVVVTSQGLTVTRTTLAHGLVVAVVVVVVATLTLSVGHA